MTILVKRHLSFFKKFHFDVWEFSLLTYVLEKGQFFRRVMQTRFSRFYPYSGSPFKFRRIFNFFFHLFLKNKELRKKRFRRFIYRVDLIEREERRVRKNDRFSSLRIIKYLFAILSYKQFRTIARRVRKKEGFIGSLYLLALEGRLINFLYRSLFSETIFESFFLIKQGYVTVNRKVITFPNAVITIYDILSFVHILKRRVYLFLAYRLITEDNVLFSSLGCIFTSFRFLYCYLYKAPLENDFTYRRALDYKIENRWPIDIYRAAGYAF